MKILLTILAVTAVLLGAPVRGTAADTLVESAPEKVAGLPKTAAVPGEVKTIPMHSRADTIDTKARIFITKRKDGVEVKNVITDTTEIKQGQAAAKLEDIKVGDYVSGSRKKLSETEYTVVKITRFGPFVSKKAAAAQPAEKQAN